MFQLSLKKVTVWPEEPARHRRFKNSRLITQLHWIVVCVSYTKGRSRKMGYSYVLVTCIACQSVSSHVQLETL